MTLPNDLRRVASILDDEGLDDSAEHVRDAAARIDQLEAQLAESCDLARSDHHGCTAIIGWHDLRAMSVTGLYQQIKARDARIDALEAKVERLESRGITDMQHRIAELEKAIGAAVAELDSEHRPYDPRTNIAVSPGLHRTDAKLGCVICWPSDGFWPCPTRMLADELRSLVAPETGE